MKLYQLVGGILTGAFVITALVIGLLALLWAAPSPQVTVPKDMVVDPHRRLCADIPPAELAGARCADVLIDVGAPPRFVVCIGDVDGERCTSLGVLRAWLRELKEPHR